MGDFEVTKQKPMETAKGLAGPGPGRVPPLWPGSPSHALQGPCHLQLHTWGRMASPLCVQCCHVSNVRRVKGDKFVCYTDTVLIKGDVII